MNARTALLRLAATVVVVATVVGALVFPGHRAGHLVPCAATGPASPTTASVCIRERRPSWADPAVLGILVVGLASAAAFLTARGGSTTPAQQSGVEHTWLGQCSATPEGGNGARSTPECCALQTLTRRTQPLRSARRLVTVCPASDRSLDSCVRLQPARYCASSLRRSTT